MRTKEIEGRVERAISERVFPGCVVGVVSSDGDFNVSAFGSQTYEPDAHRVREDTIYDVASVTKSIPTATLALMLLQEQKLYLDELVHTYLPEFRNRQSNETTLRHLLTYTVDRSGLALLAKSGITAEALIDNVLTTDFRTPPGTHFAYSNTPSLLLGLVIERVMDASLSRLADERLFGPLGMMRTTFDASSFPLLDIAPTEHDAWRGSVHGVVHDESAYLLHKSGKTAGNAGLFSTVPDLLVYMAMLLMGGRYRGRTYLGGEMMRSVEENQLRFLGARTALGFELAQPHFMGTHCGARAFGKTGFTGCSFWCDRERGMGLVLLSNQTYPNRRAGRAAIDQVRSDLADIVLAG